jgi:hypothetical protein
LAFASPKLFTLPACELPTQDRTRIRVGTLDLAAFCCGVMIAGPSSKDISESTYRIGPRPLEIWKARKLIRNHFDRQVSLSKVEASESDGSEFVDGNQHQLEDLVLIPPYQSCEERAERFPIQKTAGLPRSNPQPGIGFAPRHEDRIGIGIQSVGRHARWNVTADC